MGHLHVLAQWQEAGAPAAACNERECTLSCAFRRQIKGAVCGKHLASRRAGGRSRLPSSMASSGTSYRSRKFSGELGSRKLFCSFSTGVGMNCRAVHAQNRL